MKQFQDRLGPQGRPASRRTTSLLALAASAFLAVPGHAQDDAPTGYVRAGEQGASVRNLADRSGHPILDVAPGGILAVHGQGGTWLEVESPGGFEVWVFGKYVSETNTPGVLQVSGNHVNMRPKPSSDVDSFPLKKRLFAGDRVAYLGRAQKNDTWDEDWIQIATPPGVRGWVLADQVVTAPTAEGKSAWSAAVVAARARPVPAGAPAKPKTAGASPGGAQAKAAAAPLAEEKQDAVRALRRADELFSAERLKDQPDLELVRGAYAEVLELTETGATADLARSGIARVEALAEARALQAELESERLRREAEAERYRRELEAASQRKRDPFAGRYAHRGWLERVDSKKTGSAPTYFLRFGGRQVVEIVCSSGRYDLDDFAGFEIGVRGALLREGASAPDGQTGSILPSIDVGRVEVISGRSR